VLKLCKRLRYLSLWGMELRRRCVLVIPLDSAHWFSRSTLIFDAQYIKTSPVTTDGAGTVDSYCNVNTIQRLLHKSLRVQELSIIV
jgi:hypothetical protein